jgi:hypothetical protein
MAQKAIGLPLKALDAIQASKAEDLQSHGMECFNSFSTLRFCGELSYLLKVSCDIDPMQSETLT